MLNGLGTEWRRGGSNPSPPAYLIHFLSLSLNPSAATAPTDFRLIISGRCLSVLVIKATMISRGERQLAGHCDPKSWMAHLLARLRRVAVQENREPFEHWSTIELVPVHLIVVVLQTLSARVSALCRAVQCIAGGVQQPAHGVPSH